MKLKAFLLLGLLFISPLASAATCVAATYSQVVACIASNTTVKISANITLGVGQKILIANKSGVVLDGFYGGVNHSISESLARYAADTGRYIEVHGSNGITIKNIEFKSNFATLSDCVAGGPRYNLGSCLGMVFFNESDNLLVDNCIFDAAKTFLVQFASVRDSWITNSNLKMAATYGVWMWAPLYQNVNKNINFYGNTFSQIGANAIMLGDIEGSWVGNNQFIDNHLLTQYLGYGGGQVVVEQMHRNSKDINVTGNVFKTTMPTNASGFELAAFDNGTTLTNFNLQYNRFEGNPNDAFVIGPAVGVYSSYIRDTEFINNYRTFKSQTITKAAKGITLSNNYVESSASIGISGFADTPTTCTRAPGSSHCSVNIKWDVNLLSGGNLRITVRSATSADDTISGRYNFAASINSDGQQAAPWIDATGVIFEMYYESDYAQAEGWGSPVATITVKAI